MSTFFDAHDLGELPGPDWLRARRRDAAAALGSTPLPSEKEEIWRYSPIDRLDLASYALTAEPEPGELPVEGTAFVEGVQADLPERAATAVTCGGHLLGVADHHLPAGVVVRGAAAGPAVPLGAVVGGADVPDVFVVLNDALHPDAVVVDVAPGTTLSAPVVVVHWCDTAPEGAPAPWPATFPRTFLRVGADAEVAVVEVVAGSAGDRPGLVAPVVEATVGDGGRLAYVSLQVLGTGAWHLGRLAGRVGRDATLRAFTMGLGGDYDRVRSDVAAAGPGGATELRSAYLGSGHQVHDIRTLQDHGAPRTTSDLLCKGAVADESRSVYSGLIRVRKGAVRSDAMQTNHSLVLGRGAHADSVPNLDIQENDVRCSHASTVGPIDEDQRYYLESRGIRPDRAEALIVLGFFDDVIGRVPVPAAAPRLRREVRERLRSTLGLTGTERSAPTGELGPAPARRTDGEAVGGPAAGEGSSGEGRRG